jgi:hypothetical protein
MKQFSTLSKLMQEFAILDMEPNPLEDTDGLGLEFPPEEDEYELDADGNIVLDADGNPVKKVKPVDGAAIAPVTPECSCNHTADAVPPQAQATMPTPPPPAEEFDFNV